MPPPLRHNNFDNQSHTKEKPTMKPINLKQLSTMILVSFVGLGLMLIQSLSLIGARAAANGTSPTADRRWSRTSDIRNL
jgi:hypothetical protein